MRRLSVTLFAAALALLAVSCDKKQMDTIYDKQENYIESIVERLSGSAEDVTVERSDGTVRVTVAHGEGTALQENGAVAFYYAGHFVNGATLNASNLFSTNYETYANSVRWKVTDSSAFEILTVKLGQDDIVKGLRNGLPGVKAGDECYILFNGSLGFGKKMIANIPSNSALAYHLWIKSVSND